MTEESQPLKTYLHLEGAMLTSEDYHPGIAERCRDLMDVVWRDLTRDELDMLDKRTVVPSSDQVVSR